MTTTASASIIQRVWNYCNVLRDDGDANQCINAPPTFSVYTCLSAQGAAKFADSIT